LSAEDHGDSYNLSDPIMWKYRPTLFIN